jgi:multiple sugar transport system substrate-binding protein
MKKKEFRYMEMAKALRTEIIAGFLKPGEFLPPEKELCQMYDISRNSLRQALELLTNEGLLVKMVGRGTMVVQPADYQQRGSNVLNILCPNISSFVDKALPILSAKFKEYYPNVEIRTFGTGIRSEGLLTELSSLGVNIDIVIMRDQDLQRLQLDEYMPLDDLMRDHTGVLDKLVRTFRHKSRNYAIPITYSSVFLAGNPHVFRDAGVEMPTEDWTMEQFLDTAKRLTRDSNGDGLPDIYGFGLSSSIYRWPVLAMKLGYLLRMQESGGLPMEMLKEVLELLQGMVYRDRICPIMEVNDWSFLAQLFNEGRLGMMLTTTLTTNMKLDKFPITVLPLPKGPGAIQGSLSIANGMMIPKISENPELAKRFLQFAMREDFQRQMAQEAGFFSIYGRINQEVWSDQNRLDLGVDHNELEQSYFMRELLPDFKIQTSIEREMVRFWSGFDTPSDLIERFKLLR